MQTYGVFTQKYDIALDRLLARRLEQCGCVYALSVVDSAVFVTVGTRASMTALAEALIQLMCRDLVYFELAHSADALPLTLGEKQDALHDALTQARLLEPPADARAKLLAYLDGNDRINLEGYMRFRLRPQTELWRACLEHAVSELLLRREFTELLGVLGKLAQEQKPRIRELSVCLNADGSCTLTDDSDAVIEYADGTPDGIISLLVSLAPMRLTVYDLSGGSAKALSDAIAQVFSGRVRIYR